MPFRLLPEAEEDLSAIVEHIADDSPTAALRWYGAVLERCRLLGGMPGLGAAYPEIRPGLRMLPIGNYLVLYRATDDGVDIVRVLHGARRWQGLL